MNARQLSTALVVAVLAVLAAGLAAEPAAATECFTGETPNEIFCRNDGNSIPDSVEVPRGAVGVLVVARGGHGSQDNEHIGPAGQGGIVQGTFAVGGGELLGVYAAASGYGSNSKWGYSSGGEHGIAEGILGYDGGAGGGASAVTVGEGSGLTPMIVAGGGGGGGGAGDANPASIGGRGGDGSGGDGPGSPRGSNGTKATQQPYPFQESGGIGGGGGFDGEQGGHSNAPFDGGGAGGGGGGGYANPSSGGGGGGVPYYVNDETSFDPDYFGAGGGGGGDSYAAPAVEAVTYSVASQNCPEGGGNPECEGEVTLLWLLRPGRVEVYAGSGQAAIVGDPFATPLVAKVVSEGGQPVAEVPVTFNLPTTGPSARFDQGGEPRSVTAVTNARGIATAPTMTADETAGSWTATATVANLPPARFALRNQPVATATLVEGPARAIAGVGASFTARVAAARASAGTPTGTVAFFADGAQICAGGAVHCAPVPLDGAGNAASAAIALDAGSHRVEALYSGGGHFEPSQGSLIQAVERARALVTVVTDPNPSLAGETLQATATVVAAAPSAAAPEGTVRFSVDGETPGDPVELAGGSADLALQLPAGEHEILALYSGDAMVAPASAAAAQAVGPDATALVLSSSQRPANFGDPPTVSARLHSRTVAPSGTVDFTLDGGALCEGVAAVPLDATTSVAQCTPAATALPPGDDPIEVRYTPTGSFEPATATIVQEVEPAPTRALLTATPTPAEYAGGFLLAGAVEATEAGLGSPAGSVRFSLDGAPVGNPGPLGAGGNAAYSPPPGSALPAGIHVAGLSYSGDAIFDPARAAAFLGVEPQRTVTTLASSADPAPAGSAPRVSAVVRPLGGSREASGSVQFRLDGSSLGAPVALASGTATSPPLPGLAPGEHDVEAIFGDPAGNFLGSRGVLLQVAVGPPAAPAPLPAAGPGRCSSPLRLTSVFAVGAAVRVNGLAPLALVGERVTLRRGSRRVGAAAVRFDGTFSARIRGAGRSGSRYRAVAGELASPALGLAGRLAITNEGVSDRADGRVRLRLAEGSRRGFVLSRQLGCASSYSRLRTVHTDADGDLVLSLPRPAPGEGPALFRLQGGGSRPVVSQPIVVREPLVE